MFINLWHMLQVYNLGPYLAFWSLYGALILP